jgi:uncharacterized protein YdhG (YjbR/CyaY superfamily)
MNRRADTPKQYLDSLEEDQLRIVKKIRKVIKKVAPKVVETIGYGMLDYPGYANLGAQKRYVSLYVVPKVLAKHKKNFTGLSAGKSCLRYTKIEQVDEAALAALLKDVGAYRAATKAE